MRLAWRRRTWLESTASASPAFSASPRPYSAASVGRPRRRSLPSTMSSWTRKALCSSSIATATGRTSRVAAAEGAARRHAQRRPERLARPARVLARDAVEPAVRLAVGDRVEHRAAHEAADVLGVGLDEVGAVGGQHGSIDDLERQPEPGRALGLDRAAVDAGAQRVRPRRARRRRRGSTAPGAASTSRGSKRTSAPSSTSPSASLSCSAAQGQRADGGGRPVVQPDLGGRALALRRRRSRAAPAARRRSRRRRPCSAPRLARLSQSGERCAAADPSRRRPARAYVVRSASAAASPGASGSERSMRSSRSPAARRPSAWMSATARMPATGSNSGNERPWPLSPSVGDSSINRSPPFH